jgi:LuxR family transcriptional regulator, maltose regulon positive regulatory protein
VVSAVAGVEQNAPGEVPERADPKGDPFLRTRFAVPVRPTTFLRRDRLVERLDEAGRTPLTLVEGAAGAGKTLLAADWAAGRDGPVAWLTADTVGQVGGMFWAYLLEALRLCGAGLPEVDPPTDAHRVDPATLTRLATALSEREQPVTVVLDEFDRVTAPEVPDQLDFVLHHAGAGLRLVLVTRTEPLLPLHRYRVAGEVTEIRDAELAFTPEEAATLLKLHGLRLPPAEADALVERTRGWAAGLRLCALAARESPHPESYLKEFEADRTPMADYLLAEVLKRQTPETQDLLLRTSVLDRFCPDLANALTGRLDAEPILAGLHRANAFVEHLGHTWYRLHPLFGEILRAHLHERAPGLEPELHRRAAEWLRESGSLTETLDHGAAAGVWDFTAGVLVDDLAIGQLFTGLRSDELADLFSRMGPEAKSPATDLVRAARELARHDVDRGLAHLRHAEESLVAQGPAEDATDLAAAWLSCALLEAVVARQTGSPGKALRAVAAAERLSTRIPADLLEKHPELTAQLVAHLGSALLWAGRFEDARTALSSVADASGGAVTELLRADCLGRLALIDCLNGWTGRAERTALAATAAAERCGPPQPSGCGVGRLVLAAVALDRDDLASAESLLETVDGSESMLRDPVLDAGQALTTARLLLARDRTRAALRAVRASVPAEVASPWAEACTTLITSDVHLAEGRPQEAAELLRSLPEDQPACAVGAARAQLAAGRADAALDLLDRAHPEERGGPAVSVRATLVRAQAAHQAGDPAATRRLLARALHQARRDELRRPFHEAGPWIRPFLAAPPLRELAGWLQPGTAHPQAAPAADDSVVIVEQLSGRERDVLRRAAEMMSTEEIAADLYVSVNTVKTHLKSAYRKLAVNRRNDAVRRARELRLL